MNKSFGVYVVVGAALVLAGVTLTMWLSQGEQEDLSAPSEQAESLETPLPDGFAFFEPFQDSPLEVLEILDAPVPVVVLPSLEPPVEIVETSADTAEEPIIIEPVVPTPVLFPRPSAALVNEIEPSPILAVAEPIRNVHVPTVPAQEEPAKPVQEASAVSVAVAPMSHVYFYTGIPVRPAPMPIVPMHTFSYASYTSVTYTHTSVVHPYVVHPYVAPVFPYIAPSWECVPRVVYFPPPPVRRMWYAIVF